MFYRLTINLSGINSNAPIRMDGFVSRVAAEQYMVKFAMWNSGRIFTYTIAART